MTATTERQELIQGWNQQRLADAAIVVYGHGWLGTLTVCGLASLGIGNIAWIGRRHHRTQRVVNWLLGPPGHFRTTQIFEYPLGVEYDAELTAILGRHPWQLFVIATDERLEFARCRDFAAGQKRPWIGGLAAHGGQVVYAKYELRWPGNDETEDAIVALAVAAQLTDYVRDTLCPLGERMPPPEGCLELDLPPVTRTAVVEQVGVGGIGVWSALALAAAGDGRYALRLIDSDHVELSNRNRQVLFSEDDAQQRRPKAVAAAATLRRLFAGLRVWSHVRRLGSQDIARIGNKRRQPHVLISALDNGAGRLVVQEMGQQAEIPVVHGGTGTFAADCLTQSPGGISLDQQLHGALSEASQRESQRRRGGGCAADPSYVVPSMMAGALVAWRTVQVCEGQQADIPPLHWRSGSSIVTERSQRDELDFTQLALSAGV